jgi:hypothetical protein
MDAIVIEKCRGCGKPFRPRAKKSKVFCSSLCRVTAKLSEPAPAEEAKELVLQLRRMGLVGRIAPVYRSDPTTPVYGLLVPRALALVEFNEWRREPIAEATFNSALAICRIDPYPRQSSAHWGPPEATYSGRPDLRFLETAPEQGRHPTPGALRGNDHQLEYYEDGYPKLPTCLDRRDAAA